MHKAQLIEALADVPDDYNIEFGKFLVLDKLTDEGYMVRLDLPCAGIAQDDQSKDVVFLVGMNTQDLPMLVEFSSNIEKLEGSCMTTKEEITRIRKTIDDARKVAGERPTPMPEIIDALDSLLTLFEQHTHKVEVKSESLFTSHEETEGPS